MGWRLAFTSYGGAAGPPGPAGPVGPAGPPGPAGNAAPLTNDEGATIAVCQPVYSSSSGKVKLGRADAAATSIVAGLVSDATIANGAIGNVQSAGFMTKTTAQWDAQTGDVGGLVPGAQYWLSDVTAGKLVKVAPGAGSYDTLIGQALSATEMQLTIEQPLGPI